MRSRGENRNEWKDFSLKFNHIMFKKIYGFNFNNDGN